MCIFLNAEKFNFNEKYSISSLFAVKNFHELQNWV
jgi:hypothetical protein